MAWRVAWLTAACKPPGQPLQTLVLLPRPAQVEMEPRPTAHAGVAAMVVRPRGDEARTRTHGVRQRGESGGGARSRLHARDLAKVERENAELKRKALLLKDVKQSTDTTHEPDEEIHTKQSPSDDEDSEVDDNCPSIAKDVAARASMAIPQSPTREVSKMMTESPKTNKDVLFSPKKKPRSSRN